MDVRKRNSKNQESRVAKEVSGKVTPASGALWGSKGDVRNDLFLIECKTTKKDFYSLTFTVWNKIYVEAIKDGLRIPVMCIDLNNGSKRFAVLCTKDLDPVITDKLPKPDCLKGNIKSSFRLTGVDRRLITNNKKTYDLSVIDWDDFLEVAYLA